MLPRAGPRAASSCLSYAEKLAAYRVLADDYFEVDRYRDFVDSRLRHAARAEAAKLAATP